jgi:peptidoglycan/LPS O-acetylase OafA/YrhL
LNAAGLAARQIHRVPALDGLRGVAALIVLVYHFFCMLLPQLAPAMTDRPHVLVNFPIAILWNGPFAVSIFFVLSGFVMAAATKRHPDCLLGNAVSRYVRLVVPVTASVLLAWALLNLFPTAAIALQAELAAPSRWLNYTYQQPIPSLASALGDGVYASFATGVSRFNNALWTMQIELFGSLIVFAMYWVARHSWVTLALMFIVVAATMVGLRNFYYLSFLAGLAVFEFSQRWPSLGHWTWLSLLGFGGGIVLGAPGHGAQARFGLPEAPLGIQSLEFGAEDGLIPVVAAIFILCGVLFDLRVARFFSSRICRFFGWISFPLYLVHVPILYTVIAFLYVEMEIGIIPLFLIYVALAVLFAVAGAVIVEEPTLRLTKRVRRALAPCENSLTRAAGRRVGVPFRNLIVRQRSHE